MTGQQIKQLVKRYRGLLAVAGDEAQAAGFDTVPTRGETVRHLLHMCDELDRMLGTVAEMDEAGTDFTEEFEKIMRWLGFMQGVFWSSGQFTMNELRGHNSPKPAVDPYEDNGHGCLADLE